MSTRRRFMAAGGCALAGLLLAAPRAAGGVVEIRMRSDADGAHVGFDPVGVLLVPGMTVRWVCEAGYHTTTAYHPANGGHSLRIPRATQPWTSDILQPEEKFEFTPTVEGVYDYLCVPHEHAGMVGRLIVGKPSGPGSLPFDWFKGVAEGSGWLEVPAEARAVFPPVDEILRRKVVPAKPL